MPRRGSQSTTRSPGTVLAIIAAVSAAILACATAWRPEPQSYHRTTADLEDAEILGFEDCLDCHEEVQGHAPAPAYHEDCEGCDEKPRKIEVIEREVTLEGDLSEAERERLLEIADRCPVHRTLHSELQVKTRLVDH